MKENRRNKKLENLQTVHDVKTNVKSDYNAQLSLETNVKNLTELTHDCILMDLEKLADKHPEMFKKPSDVFRLVRKVLENPTHFYQNNRLDASLIVKYVESKKVGKVVVTKEEGKVIHATKVTDKDLKRLEKRSQEKVGSADIIQTFTQQGSKQEETRLGLPNEADTKIIPQNSQFKLKKLSKIDTSKSQGRSR